MYRPIDLKIGPNHALIFLLFVLIFLMHHLFVSGNYLYYLVFHFYFSQRSCNAR